MSAKSEPPHIPGFTYERWLGGGGFADVFLYEQQRPRRQVAIKVLRPREGTSGPPPSFDAEGDLMASVSTHPYIVSVFGVDVAPDGRPHLVMEYYPKPHFGQRLKEGPLGVPEVLRLGVRVASAVETAHRAGILHRDIKPGNILTNDYGLPGLTDFGISSMRSGATLAAGVSVPYAPPEVLDESSPGTEASDVYSLGATLYALLAGRSPFERPDRRRADELVDAIMGEPAPGIGRHDVPQNLEWLLLQTLDKNPDSRPQRASSLARALQQVELELHLPQTQFEVRADAPAEPRRPVVVDDNDGTFVGRVAASDPRPVITSDPRSVPVPVGEPPVVEVPTASRFERPAPEPTVTSSTAEPVASSLVHDTSVPPRPVVRAESLPTTPVAAAGRAQRGVAAAAAVLVLALVLGLGFRAAVGGDDDPGPDVDTTVPGSTPSTGSAESPATTPASPTAVVVRFVEGGMVEVSWQPVDPVEGDRYRLRRKDDGHTDDPFIDSAQSPAQIGPVAAGEVPCVEVVAIRGDRQSPPSDPVCAR